VDAARDGLDIGKLASQPLLDACAELGSQLVIEDTERVRPKLVGCFVQP
jgi:hypothetical protein